MPSYKKHILFSLIMALPFLPDVFYLSLAVIGTSIIDFDHDVNKDNLMTMVAVGIALALILYLLNLPSILGIILVMLALIFYISKHRGFMHSVFGVTVIAALLSFLVFVFYLLLAGFTDNAKVYLIVISLVLGFLVLNRKLIIPYSGLVLIGIVLTPNSPLNLLYIFGALFLGCLSHIILDLFTHSGVGLFNPLSPKKYKKVTGIFLLAIWIFSAVWYSFNYLV